MTKLIVKKSAWALLTILIISFVMFSLIEAMPESITGNFWGCVQFGCTYHSGLGIDIRECRAMRIDNLGFGERARHFMRHGFGWRNHVIILID